MIKLKILFVIFFAVLVSVSCSLVDKIKEKMSSNKEEQKKEQTVDNKTGDKEKTVEGTSGDDLAFYNKYIDVLNKIQETGNGLNKSYTEDIPAPKSIRKGMILVSVIFDLKVGDMERTIKEQRRSYYDGGELSKLTAAAEMKKEIEDSFKSVLDAMDSYYKTAKNVSDYYKNKEYENDPSKASGYDDEMKSQYQKFKTEFDKFAAALKKYKPKRKQRDTGEISDPGQKSLAVLMNAYENTLDKAEDFYDQFQKVDKSSDLSSLAQEINSFESAFAQEKKNVELTEFTDVTKGFKYSFEDYFSKTVSDFVREARKFTDGSSRKESEFNRSYDNVVTYYNYMINSYNTSINSINTVSKYY
jgi:hypothetical protein